MKSACGPCAVTKASPVRIELAFDYHSRLYVYQMQPDWYEDFLSVEDEILSLISGPEDMDDDDEPLGGYFSKN
jgi:hypothetical protein